MPIVNVKAATKEGSSRCLPGLTDGGFQVQLAEYFRNLLDKEGPEAFDLAASRTMAGLSAMIYQTRGPEVLQDLLQVLPKTVERDLLKHLKPFTYQVIPPAPPSPSARGC
jgi:hypothetical protein